MRPTELKNLNWGDIIRFSETVGKSLGERLENDIVIRASGKKNKHSNIVAMKSVRPFLDTLWQRFKDDTGKTPKDDSPVFAGADGNRIESFKQGLTNLLTAADVLFDRSGNRRSAYSFRHFYIKRLLLAGLDVFTVAINTRTSVEMIQKFYVPEITPERRASSLNPKWKADRFAWAPVRCQLDGQRMPSTKNSLSLLLSAVGLKGDAFRCKRTAYSFRHTYASNQRRGHLHADHQHTDISACG